MSDELDVRVRKLEAERARPDVRDPSIEELLARLVATIASAFRTPPDKEAR